MQGGLEEFTWDIVWDREGVAYLARERIWRWDGTVLEPVGPDIFTEMHAIAMDRHGRILAGGINEFGYYDPETGQYLSLMDRLPPGQRQFGRAWAIHDDGQAFWMGSSNRLFRIGPDSTEIHAFEGKHRVVFHFLESGVYAHEAEVGLWKVENGRKILLNDHPELIRNSIMFLEDLNDGRLQGISSAGIFSIKEYGVGSVSHVILHQVLDVPISTVKRIDEDRILIGTLGEGLHLLINGTDLIELFRRNPKVSTALIIGIGKHPRGGVWVSIDSRVDFYGFNLKALNLADIFPSTYNSIQDAIKFDDEIYLLSKSAIGFHRLSRDGKLERIISEEIFRSIRFVEGSLFLSTYNQIKRFSNSDISTLHEFDREIWSFVVVGERVVVGFSDRIGVYRMAGDRGLELLWEQSLPSGLRVLEADASGTVWGWDPMGPLLEFRWRETGGFQLIRHETIGGLPLRGQRHSFSMTDTGPVVIVADRIARRRGPGSDWEVARLDRPPGTLEATTFDADDSLLNGWMVSWDAELKSHFLAELSWEAGKQPETRVLPWIDMNELGRISLIRSFADGEHRLLIGGMKGVLWADPGLSAAIPVPSRPVLFHRGERLRKGSVITTRYGENVLRFRYSSPGGNIAYPVRYQTRLAGRDEGWSEPSENPFRELGLVWEGRYGFQVRSVDPFGRFSPVATVNLRIHPPWFRTPLAWLLYLAGLVLLGWLIFLIQGRRLRRRQALLEEEVRLRTFELERANRFKDDFIANLSHEIRNPLNGVIGSIRQLKPDVALPERTLKSLRGAAHYLQTTVEEVLDFAKLESGKIAVETAAFDISEIVSGIVEIHHPAAHGKGLTLATRLQIPEGLAVVSDARKIQQIIGNLVGNAVKFTETGGVTLGIRIEPEGEGKGALRIWVEDSGRGIPASEQEQIFDKFYQGKQGSLKTAGTGIGLSLVKTFTDSLGGQLTLESEPGKGSTFIVNLRVGLQPLEDASRKQAIERKYEGLRILIVEDLEYNRTVLEDFLSEIGCETESAENGIDALALARKQSFAVILLDWELPGKSGLEVARELRADPAFSGKTVIAGMTAYATAEDQRICLESGMDVFLSKPISHHQLLEILDRATGDKTVLNGPGLLMEMTHGDDLPATYRRWIEFHATYRAELKAAVDEGTPETIRKAAHRLLGHLRMLDLDRLPGMVADLMTAAQVGDREGVRKEWRELAPLLDQLEREVGDQS